jgi:hypothetical protein
VTRLALALVIGCGAPTPPTAPVPAPPPTDAFADCARAGSNVASVLHLDADHAPPIAAVVEHHCRADAWPAAAQTCVAAAVDHAAALKCAYEHLTEQQHDLVVADMRPLLPAPPAQPSPAHDPSDSQAAIASRDDVQGEAMLQAKRFAEASVLFRDAAARVPEARYFVDLCESLYGEGKFGEALTACNAAKDNGDTDDGALRARRDKLADRIKADAHQQGINMKAP